MPLPRYVLFDAVGTLIYPEPTVAEVYAAQGRRYGSQLSADEIRSRFRAALARETPAQTIDEQRERDRWRRIVGEIFDDVAQQSDQLFEDLWSHFAAGKHWRLFPDVTPTWEELTQCGLMLGIASNFDGRLRAVCLHHPPLADSHRLFVSSEIGFVKPDPRFFTTIASQLSAVPEDILLVGDDPRCDIDAARGAGWQALKIDRAALAPAPGVIRDLRELIDLARSA